MNITQIASCAGDWYLVHYISRGEQTFQAIFPVAAWALVDGAVVGLIGVENEEGRLIGPPPGVVGYKQRAELTPEQLQTCNEGRAV